MGSDASIEQILAIDGNEPYLEELRDRVRRRCVVPFVGAGLSVPFGYPGWRDLLSTQGRRFGLGDDVDNELASGRYEEAASILVESPETANVFQDLINIEFRPRSSLLRERIGGAPRALAALPPGPVVTTNYDEVLERVHVQQGRPFESIARPTDGTMLCEALSGNRHALLKIHGHWGEPTNRILTLAEYERFYGASTAGEIDASKHLPQALRLMFQGRTVLFVGCSLEEDRYLRMLRRLVADGLYTPVHFALLQDEGNIPARRQALARARILPIFFPPGAFGLIEVILDYLAPTTDVSRSIAAWLGQRATRDEREWSVDRPPSEALPSKDARRELSRLLDDFRSDDDLPLDLFAPLGDERPLDDARSKALDEDPLLAMPLREPSVPDPAHLEERPRSADRAHLEPKGPPSPSEGHHRRPAEEVSAEREPRPRPRNEGSRSDAPRSINEAQRKAADDTRRLEELRRRVATMHPSPPARSPRELRFLSLPGDEADVPAVPPGLRAALDERRCVAFIGSGASVDAGLPTWIQLVHDLVTMTAEDAHLAPGREAQLRAQAERGELFEVLDFCMTHVPERVHRAIAVRFDARGLDSPTHDLLAELPFRAIVTTNYDTFPETRRSPAAVLGPEDIAALGADGTAALLAEADPFPVLKIHGSARRPEGIFFGTKDYEPFLRAHPGYREGLLQVLSSWTLFFYGTSFSDERMLEVLEAARSLGDPSRLPHYAVVPHATAERHRELEERFGVQVIGSAEGLSLHQARMFLRALLEK